MQATLVRSEDFANTITSIGSPILAIATVVLAVATLVLARQAKKARIEERSAINAAVEAVNVSNKQLHVAIGASNIAQESLRADQLRRRGEASIEAVRVFVTESSKYHAQLLILARERETTVTKIWQNHESMQTDILAQYIDELEVLAVGVQLGVYDINVVQHIAQGFITHLWTQATPYVAARRAGTGGLPPHESAYEHAEWLAQRLHAKKGPAVLSGTLPPISASPFDADPVN